MLCDGGMDLYGFDTWHEPPSTAYHYYDDDRPNEGLDGVDASKRLLVHLARREAGCVRTRD